MSELQPGIVAFLFTDIEGSTRLWEADPEAMSASLSRHDAVLHGVIAEAGGRVFKTAGDAFCAIFPSAAEAVSAAVAAQRAFTVEKWAMTIPLRVRVAIHAGHAESRDGDYFGPSLNRVARLLSTAHGGQIVLSRSAHELLRGLLPAGLALRDLGEYTLKDLQLPERIFQIIAPGLHEVFPPLKTPDRLLRNLPRPATAIIGREEAVQAARSLLGLTKAGDVGAPREPERPQQPARLLTLTGPGGTGKTRLALHLAQELGIELEDGAVFVPLAAVTDAGLAPAAVAAALDLAESSGESPRKVVFEQLRDRRLLLILDNFEQIMGAAAFVADLLEACPRIQIIATSRERLNVRGEQELALPPLALPMPEISDASGLPRPLTPETIRCSPAVQLFVARAQAVAPDLDVTAENAETLAQICMRLDGLPLAIELAAARARLLPPRSLLDRLEHRLDLLSRGARDLPTRQRTMRDTIAWSYDLLEPDEQALFARLAVFVGGATIDAAAAIARTGSDRAGHLDLDLLESLAEKSLIRLLDDRDEPRLLMFQTIRDFALERLAENPEREAIARAHAEYFLALAEAAEPLLVGREQTTWLARLDRDKANLRAAIAWLRAQGELELALRLTGALWRFWWLRGDMGEGRTVLEGLLREAAEIDVAIRAKALNGAGVLAESQGEWETATRLHEESLEISRRSGDLHGVAWSLNNLGVVAINRGDFERATVLLEENLAVAEQADDAASIATALNDLGMIALNQGDLQRSVSLRTRSLALVRALGDDSQTARILNNLGVSAIEFGELTRAQDLFAESLALHRGVGDRQGIASTLNNLAEVSGALGDSDSAMELFLESHMLAMEGSNRLYAAIAFEGLARLTLDSGDLPAARTRYSDALRLYALVDDRQGISGCLAGLAQTERGDQRFQHVAALLGAYWAIGGSDDTIQLSTVSDVEQSARAALGDTAFDASWQLGHEMPMSEVVERVVSAAISLDVFAAR